MIETLLLLASFGVIFVVLCQMAIALIAASAVVVFGSVSTLKKIYDFIPFSWFVSLCLIMIGIALFLVKTQFTFGAFISIFKTALIYVCALFPLIIINWRQNAEREYRNMQLRSFKSLSKTLFVNVVFFMITSRLFQVAGNETSFGLCALLMFCFAFAELLVLAGWGFYALGRFVMRRNEG